MEHWNIQVSVQRVTEDQAAPANILSGKPPVKKTVLQIIDLKLQAETEVEAYDKLARVLTAVHPDVIVVTAGEAYQADADLPRTVRGIRDNPQA